VTPEEIIDNKYLEDLELTYITSTQLLYNKKDVDCSFSKRHRPQLRNELKSNKFSIVLTKTALLLSGKQCSEQGNISRSELFERYLRNKIFQSEIQPEIKEEQNLVLVNEKINNEIDLFSIYKHIQRLSKSEIKENLQLLNTIMRICLELLTSLWINENDNV
jgi:metal-responsive CopG/Arc/MetJ family transcriptional regulator